MNAAGQFTDEQLGADAFAGKVRIQSNFDPATGLIASRQSGTQGSLSNRQNLSYSWDANGNLQRRTDLGQSGLYESFVYDALDRLDYSTRNGTTNLDLSYDSIGNITNKSDVGNYTYPASGPTSVRPHAVTTAGSNTYAYDASGNMITRKGSSITWSTANLPTQINDPSGRYSKFSYTPDRQRWRQEATYAGGTETTIYIGSLLEKLTTSGGTVFYRHYIPAGSGTVVYTRASTGTAQTYFITSDHLGSSSSITDSTGALIVNESFDAFGKRRASNWMGTPSAADLTAIANATRQGYTGQEHLDNLDLIHMNGRVQDPTLGRFISADPFVQAPDNSQSLNRYSYVFNNPLSLTDPSGFGASAADDFQPNTPRQSFLVGISFDGLGSLGSFVQLLISARGTEPNVSGGAQVDTASQLRDQRRSPTAPGQKVSDLTEASANSTVGGKSLPPGFVRGDLGFLCGKLGQCDPRPVVPTGKAFLGLLGFAGLYGGALFAPELGLAALANPVTTNQIVITAAEISAGNALGPTSLAVGTAAVGTAAIKSRDIVEAAARTIAARGKNYLISRLTPGELAAYNADPTRGLRYLGTVIQRETALLLGQRFPGRFGSFGKGADFVDRTTGELIELTTGGQGLTKGKYGSSFDLPDLDQVAIYDLPR